MGVEYESGRRDFLALSVVPRVGSVDRLSTRPGNSIIATKSSCSNISHQVSQFSSYGVRPLRPQEQSTVKSSRTASNGGTSAVGNESSIEYNPRSARRTRIFREDLKRSQTKIEKCLAREIMFRAWCHLSTCSPVVCPSAAQHLARRFSCCPGCLIFFADFKPQIE